MIVAHISALAALIFAIVYYLRAREVWRQALEHRDAGNAAYEESVKTQLRALGYLALAQATSRAETVRGKSWPA